MCILHASAGPKGVAKFDFLVIGATAGGVACANRATELGKRVALVGTENVDNLSVSYMELKTMTLSST